MTLDQLIARYTITLPDGGIAVPNKFAYGRASHTGTGAEAIHGWFYVDSPGAQHHLRSEVLKPAGYEVERTCRSCHDVFTVPVTADRHGMPSNGRRALETVFCSESCKRRHHVAKEDGLKAAGRALGVAARRILPGYSAEYPTEATVSQVESRVYDLEVRTDELEAAVTKATSVVFLLAVKAADQDRRLAEMEERLAEMERLYAEGQAGADLVIRHLEATAYAALTSAE